MLGDIYDIPLWTSLFGGSVKKRGDGMKFDLLSASSLSSDTSSSPHCRSERRSSSKINEFPGCLTNEESLPPAPAHPQ